MHNFREVKCQWEVGEVGRWGRWKGNEVVRWEKQESGEVGRWEVPRFIQRLGTQGNLILIKGAKGQSDVNQGKEGAV